MGYRDPVDQTPRTPPQVMRIFSRPLLIFILVAVCIVVALFPALAMMRGAVLACGAGKCVAREPTFFGTADVIELPANSGSVRLLKHDEEDKSGWYLEAAPGGRWSRKVRQSDGELAIAMLTKYWQSNGVAAFELKLRGDPWLFCILLVSFVLLMWIGGHYTVAANTVVLDVERNLLRLETRYVMRKTTKTSRELSKIASATIATSEDSNESDVMLASEKGEPKLLLRAMHYDCKEIVAAIESAAARARELHEKESA